MTTLHREANEPQPNAFHELWYTLVEFIVRAFTHLNGDLDDIIQVGQLWQPVTWLHCLNYRFIILSVFAFFICRCSSSQFARETAFTGLTFN